MNDIEVKAIEFIKFYKEHCLKQEQENMKNGNYETVNDEQFVYKNLEIVLKLIENLLKERQSDKERIKDLEEINEAHKKENGELRERVKELKETQKILEHNYQVAIDETINKYEIKEKIEEYKNTFDMGEEWYTKEYIIQVLEELLKGE